MKRQDVSSRFLPPASSEFSSAQKMVVQPFQEQRIDAEQPYMRMARVLFARPSPVDGRQVSVVMVEEGGHQFSVNPSSPSCQRVCLRDD